MSREETIKKIDENLGEIFENQKFKESLSPFLNSLPTQPLIGPIGLAYGLRERNGGTTIEQKEVVAQTIKVNSIEDLVISVENIVMTAIRDLGNQNKECPDEKYFNNVFVPFEKEYLINEKILEDGYEVINYKECDEMKNEIVYLKINKEKTVDNGIFFCPYIFKRHEMNPDKLLFRYAICTEIYGSEKYAFTQGKLENRKIKLDRINESI
jgi:hypothetical protein